jgi:hypothetical protein
MGYRAPGRRLVMTTSTGVWALGEKIKTDQEIGLHLSAIDVGLDSKLSL